MITIEYTISNLEKNSVTILTQQYYNGMKLGELHARSYVNSPNGRAKLQEEVTDNIIVSAVLTVWGEESTVSDEITP